MNIKGKEVLVTGGAGFIGSHLVDRLIDLKAEVTVLDNLSYGLKKNINPSARLINEDVRNYEILKGLIKGKDMIYHLAAIATTKESALGWTNPVEDYEVNTLGTLNILRSIVELEIDPRVIYASSAAVYGTPQYVPMDECHPTNPISPYGISKLTGEKYGYAYHKENGIRITALRIFNTYGPRQPRYVMFDLLSKLYADPSKLEIMGTGQQVRDYCYVSDAVDAFILVAENDSTIGKQINVAGGYPISIKNLAELIVKLSDLKVKTELNYTGHSWKGDIERLIADISSAKALVDFNPKVNLERGLCALIQYYQR